ncbi:Autotransporter adhesin EhaG [Xylophilus ampelinus]|nr:Autotransporter adhesin EhaG [Xylophilus ampelinus]
MAIGSASGSARGAVAAGSGSTAIGGAYNGSAGASALATGSVALGTGSQVAGGASNSVAIGANSVATAANTVSFGSAGQTRALVNVSAGAVNATSTEAVNGSQLYTVQQTAGNAASAATAAQNTADSALGLAQNSAQYGAGGTALQLHANGGAGTTVTNVAAGVAATDAANVGQVQQGDQATLGSANAYTLQQVSALQTLMNQALSTGLCSYGNGSMSCGPGASAQGTGATALGQGAQANGDGTTAIGAGAQASYAGSVAIGRGARALADPTTAVGDNAIAAGNNSVALGANTLAIGNNSVALGQGSVATRDNTVSVGNAATGQSRQITNVAAGVLPGDAVNLSQMQQAVAASGEQSRQYAARGVAAALAMPQMPAQAPGKQWVGAAVGNYDGASAIGLAWGYQITEALNVGVGLSGAASGGGAKLGSRVQLGYSW